MLRLHGIDIAFSIGLLHSGAVGDTDGYGPAQHACLLPNRCLVKKQAVLAWGSSTQQGLLAD